MPAARSPGGVMTDPIARLRTAGVSVWLDDLSRERLTTGSLAALRDRGVSGVTTNPTIFAKAISDSDAYDGQIRDLKLRQVPADQALRELTASDVRQACDVLRPVYDATGGVDGRVSIEVDPRIAHDTGRTVAEARALWWLVDRPNLFVKIPAAKQGLPGDHRLPGRGDQHQRHADLLPGPLRRGDRGVPGRAGSRSRRGAGPVRHRLGRVVLRVPGGHRGGQAAGQDRHAAGRRAARQGRDRQREARLPALRAVGLPPAGGSRWRRAGARTAAPAVGLHQRQGPRLRRHPVRHRAGRPRRGQHHARGHAERGRRSRGHPGRQHPRHLRASRRPSWTTSPRSASTTPKSSRSSKTRA